MPEYEEMGLPARSRTLLIVEDNDLNRDILCTLLEEEYQIVEAANGREGIEQMQRLHEELALILLDVYMPEMDGFDFLRYRQTDDRFANIPVIVATASEAQEDEVACLKLGANDFVKKPYNAEAILNRVRNTIRLRESASVINQLRWDSLTSLYRKEFFYRRVDNLLEAYPDHSFDMVCSDIRNLRALNERYGRENCDRLLHDLASRLTVAIPGVVTSGRVGGDSFGFLIESQEDDWSPKLAPIVEGMGFANLCVRFGVVQNVDHTLDASLLCDRATLALEELRNAVGVGVSYYDDALRHRLEMEHTIIADMGKALEEHQFLVYYQPKHQMDTDAVAGAEALVRWLHPELGLIRPDVFIQVFERHGLISQLDRYVCEEACAELARLQAMGLPPVPISVNVSPLDFDMQDLPEQVLDIADKYGIDHALLHLELTETAYAEDPGNVAFQLKTLRAYGFKIELDDFGSGYSSLALLNVLPLDIVKIDGGMVRHATRLDDYRIIQSAVQIAHLLGLETVIEGVETSEAIEALRELGCDFIQGFFYSWPLRQEDFEDYLFMH